MCLPATGESNPAEEVLEEAIRSSQSAGDRRIELRARIERSYLRLLGDPGTTAGLLLETTAEAIPIFETMGDHRSLGRAWLLAGFVQSSLGRHKDWEEAGERAFDHYVRYHWPTSTCLGEIAAALYYGPTSVTDAIERCEELLLEEAIDQMGAANVRTFLGGLVAQLGDFDAARRVIGAARITYEDLGQRSVAATYCAPVQADLELLAGEATAAEQVLRDLCDELQRTNDFSHLASRASDLAEALFVQARFDEAEEWTRVSQEHAADDDIDAQTFWRSVRGKIHARRGSFESADALVRTAVQLIDASDGLSRRARVQSDLGEVLRLAGNTTEAASAFERAIDLYEQKGNLVGAAHIRSLEAELALV
jgi:tetratricopeptide (TPR) repeat protein